MNLSLFTNILVYCRTISGTNKPAPFEGKVLVLIFWNFECFQSLSLPYYVSSFLFFLKTLGIRKESLRPYDRKFYGSEHGWVSSLIYRNDEKIWDSQCVLTYETVNYLELENVKNKNY